MEQDLNIRVDTQRLEQINKGTNFFNLDNSYVKKYYISVMLDVRLDLEVQTEKVLVDTDLPILEGGYSWRCRELSVEEFFTKLKEFVKRPLGKVIIQNLGTNRAEVGSYEFGEIKHLIRDETINFEDIEITIGELAKEKLKIDFEKEVKDILNKQVSDNKQEQIDTYVRLKTKIENLKKLLCKESNSYYSNKPKDDTLKMPLTAEEYNSKLKEVEVELRKLEKEFGLREENLDYIEIKSEKEEKEESENRFKNWLVENEEELRENFKDNDEGLTFDEYAEQVYMYNECDSECEEYE